MKNRSYKLKTSTYFFFFGLVLFLVIAINQLINPHQAPTADHASLTLTPFTAREQKDLILAQEQSEQLAVSGPLVATMSAQKAQAKVLNLQQVTQPPRN